MTLPRPDYSCADCGLDTDELGEYSWIVHDHLWERSLASAHRRRGASQYRVRIHRTGAIHDLVCIGCFEKRIHRHLTPADFDWNVPLNITSGHRSRRLLDRMGEQFEHHQHKHFKARRASLKAVPFVRRAAGDSA